MADICRHSPRPPGPPGSDDQRGNARDLVGASPPFDARPVSLGVRNYLRRRAAQTSGTHGLMIAVSGGADSLALAVACAAAAAPLGMPLTARVVDHRMREGSGAEATQVVADLDALGIAAQVLTADLAEGDAAVSKMPRPAGLETVARELRHSLLEASAQKWMKDQALQSVDILLGHTMDDQAETVLLRLGRGASPDALSGMREVVPTQQAGIYRGRPLLQLRRADTEKFCKVLGLNPVEDPTNRADGPWRTRDGGALPRSAIRDHVLPSLSKAMAQDPVPALGRVAGLLAEDQDALAEMGRSALKVAKLPAPKGALYSLDTMALRDNPAAVRKRALRTALAEIGAPVPTLTHTEALDQSLFQGVNAQGDPRVVALPGRFVAKRHGSALVFSAGSAGNE